MANEDFDATRTFQRQTILNLYNSAIPTEIISFQLDIGQEEVEKIIEEDRKEQQNQDSVTVSRSMNNFLRAIGSARNHKERSGNQRPERELCRFLFSY